MAIPYNLLPMEMLVAMSTAEVANAPGYLDAARMWTEVRTWIDSARTELRTRSESLLPHWQDQAARDWRRRSRPTTPSWRRGGRGSTPPRCRRR